MHTLVSNLSCARLTSRHLQMLHTALNDVESWEIIKLLQDFPRIINRASDNFEPSIVAKFAISLAQAFNKYYAHTRILDESPERDSRLALCYATATVLKEALRLLGVEAPRRNVIISDNHSQKDRFNGLLLCFLLVI